jgi:hypothetical protein
MRQGRPIQDHAKDLKREGRDVYARAYPFPALVGMSVRGDSGRMRRVGDRATLTINISDADESQAGSIAGRVWHLARDPSLPASNRITVGRTMGHDIVMSDYSISEYHCDFLVEPTGVSLVDRGALNGTRVGRDRLAPNAPRKLADNCLVTLGRYEFQFMTPATFLRNAAMWANVK